jgi:hypothetical protein
MMTKVYMGFATVVLIMLAVADQFGLGVSSIYKGNYSLSLRSTMGQFHK